MDFHAIYESGADDYDRLVSAEDADGNLGPAIETVVELAGRAIVEVGSGTGRVTRVLAERGATVFGSEPTRDMLRVAAARTADPRRESSVALCRAEAAGLPFRSASADAVVAGWVLAHQREWSPDSWAEVVAGFLDEMERVVAPGGSIVLIETLGTGTTTPAPNDELAEYYSWLETEHGFERTWFRTDYVFASVEEAARTTGSFFGDEFARSVRANGWARVPECTGLWSRTRPG